MGKAKRGRGTSFSMSEIKEVACTCGNRCKVTTKDGRVIYCIKRNNGTFKGLRVVKDTKKRKDSRSREWDPTEVITISAPMEGENNPEWEKLLAECRGTDDEVTVVEAAIFKALLSKSKTGK